jgi:hypothetical protein
LKNLLLLHKIELFFQKQKETGGFQKIVTKGKCFDVFWENFSEKANFSGNESFRENENFSEN